MEEKIGEVFKYFKKPGVAALKIDSGNLSTGDKIRFEGEHTDFEQEVGSMEIDGEDVEEVGPGDEVGIKVKQRVRPNDDIYKVD